MIDDKITLLRKEIKRLFIWRDVSMSKVVRKLNKNKGCNFSVSNLSQKLKHGTIKFKEVAEIADILGYDIVFKPRAEWEEWEE